MTASFNPWTVNSVLDFWFLNCPECTFHTKEEGFFQTHAVINHPASSVLFGNSEKELNIDDSIDEYKENNHDYVEVYENQTPTESLDVTSISSDVEIKEEFIENLEENEPKNFSAINRLNLHTDKDQEAITYKCSKCGKTFFQSIELRKHTESFHEEIRYNCENCEKIFTQKAHLNAHIKTIHEEKNSDKWLKDQIGKEKKKIKSLKCLLCD